MELRRISRKFLPYLARSSFAFFRCSPIFFDSSSQDEMNLPAASESFSNCAFDAFVCALATSSSLLRIAMSELRTCALVAAAIESFKIAYAEASINWIE